MKCAIQWLKAYCSFSTFYYKLLAEHEEVSCLRHEHDDLPACIYYTHAITVPALNATAWHVLPFSTWTSHAHQDLFQNSAACR